MRGLTNRQTEILSFIKKYHSEIGIMPSIREIGNEFGMTAKGAFDHLIALEKKNIIRRGEGISRSIIINEKQIPAKINSNVIRNFDEKMKTKGKMVHIPKGNTCIICGTKIDIHRHHEDYNRPKEIICLCRKHHIQWHVFKRNFAKIGYKITLNVKNTI
jgi:SOS-response transcriptional repressor LexA